MAALVPTAALVVARSPGHPVTAPTWSRYNRPNNRWITIRYEDVKANDIIRHFRPKTGDGQEIDEQVIAWDDYDPVMGHWHSSYKLDPIKNEWVPHAPA